jgi:hypothetical protein
MDTDLRIPVTAEQKALIAEATKDEPEGMAAWARTILLEAARKRVRGGGSSGIGRKEPETPRESGSRIGIEKTG